MQRKYPLEPNAPSQLLLPTRPKPCPLAGPTKSGRAGIGEIGTETVLKGSPVVAASQSRSRKAVRDRRFQSRIQTW